MFLSKAVECFGAHITKIYIQGVREKDTKCSLYVKLRNKINKIWHVGLKRKTLDDYLHDLYEYVDCNLWKKSNAATKYVEDINHSSIQEEIKNSNADLILIFGGKILNGAWIDSAKYGSINMHYGILPYYRSSCSTEFALYHESYENIGATIHYIDDGVDTGPIISKHYVRPDSTNIQELLANVYRTGIDALVKTALNLINGEKIKGTRESSRNSYFPARFFSDDIKRTAGFRLKNRRRYRFPSVSRAMIGVQKNSVFYLRKSKGSGLLENGVYIFLYHSIVSSKNNEEWERSYHKILSYENTFRDHINYLSAHGKFIKLSEIPEILYKGRPKRAYYTITFDDGYSNIVDNAFKICKKKGVYPTVFVNSDFADQSRKYYRVLLSLLISRGYSIDINYEISKFFNVSDALDLFNFCKKHYSYGNTERIINRVWEKHFAGENIKCHLDWDQLRFLQQNGWEIGNHTVSHPTLSKLSYEEQKKEIENNYHNIEKNGLKCIKWLSYPNGNPWDVNEDTYKWMRNNPDWFGIVVTNGYNCFYSKDEYLRIGIANETIQQFMDKITYSNNAMKFLLRNDAVT